MRKSGKWMRVAVVVSGLLVVILFLAGLAACGGGASPSPTQTLSPTATASPTTPKPTTTPAQTTTATPKAQPASHAGRTACLVCHETGVSGAPKVPAATHQGRTDATCAACHKLS